MTFGSGPRGDILLRASAPTPAANQASETAGPKSRSWQRWGALAAALVLVACATQDSAPPVSYDQDRASRLFSVGYQDVSEIYIDDIAIADLAIAGMDSLSSIDPGIDLDDSQGRLRLTVDGLEAAVFPRPASIDAEQWGEVTAEVISISRSRSADLDQAEAEEVYEAVFDGVLTQLDSFSRYAGWEEARENRASRDGFGGIGVRIRLIEDGVRILSVMENTPAEEAGLEDNDIITHIDGAPTAGLSQRDVVRRLRGPVRSEVRVTVDRDGAAGPLSLPITRAHIVPQTVKYEREGNLAILRVTGFNQNTTRSLRETIRMAKREVGPALQGYIIDLRSNPGGLLDQAVGVSDLFVAGGRIVSTHGRHPDSHQYFEAGSGDLTDNSPIIVLINGNSASASEIVAAALQDLGRAVVIGSASYGKGTVQTVLRLPNQGELTLTWARFHAPSGYALHKRGVLPDICTSGDDIEGMEQVLEHLRSGDLPLPPDVRRRNVQVDDDEAVENLRAHCPPREASDEIDLRVAKRLLSDPALFARARGVGSDTAARRANQLSAAPQAPAQN